MATEEMLAVYGISLRELVYSSLAPTLQNTIQPVYGYCLIDLYKCNCHSTHGANIKGVLLPEMFNLT